MSDIKKLSEKCECSVSVSINMHRDFYQTVLNYLFERADIPNLTWQERNGVDLTSDMLKEHEIEVGVLNKMIELNTIVEVQCYPSTPVGFFTVFHYDVDEAIKTAMQ